MTCVGRTRGAPNGFLTSLGYHSTNQDALSSKAALFQAQTATERCKRWVHKCGRPNFTVENAKKDTYICSKHFVDGEPTIQNPDPVKATN